MKTRKSDWRKRPWKWFGQGATLWAKNYFIYMYVHLSELKMGYNYFAGAQASLFTAVNYNLYQPPPGFCFDIYCNDEPIIDDPVSKDYNVEQRVID